MHTGKKRMLFMVFSEQFHVFYFFFAIFLPWLQIRGVSLKSVYFLCAEHIATNSMSFSYMIGDYLQRFEITTGYTSSFADDDGLVRCDPEHMFYFKKFCDHINNDAVLRPYRYYLGHNQTDSCQLEYYSNEENTDQPNNSFFKLFYLFPYNETYDMIRVYNETVDFKNWNFFTDGEFVEFVDVESSNLNFYDTHKEPFWTTGLAEFGSQNESRVFTILYPVLGKYDPAKERRNKIKDINKMKEKKTKIKPNSDHFSFNKNLNVSYTNIKAEPKQNTLFENLKDLFFYYEKKIMNQLFNSNENEFCFAKSIEEAKTREKSKNKTTNEFRDDGDNDMIVVSNAGSSFFTESLYFILKQQKHDKYNHYIITDYMYNVLIEKDMGAVYPKYFEKRQSVFPNISDINSSIWNSVEKEIIEVPIDVPLLVNVTTSIQYMIIKRVINTRSRYSYYIIMLFEINPKILEIYSLVTNVFVICLVFLLIIFYLIRLSLFSVEYDRNNKLINKQRAIIANTFNEKGKKNSQIINPYEGKVIEAINKLRLIQLMNSSDFKLNDFIDLAIEEMTKNDEDLFQMQVEEQIQIKDEKRSEFCPFCSYLMDYNQDLSVLKAKYKDIKKKIERESLKARKILNFYLNNNNKIENDKNKNQQNIFLDMKSKDSQLFHIWNIRVNSAFNLNCNAELLDSNPHLYLVRKFMKFIQKQNLLIAEIYPDNLLTFVIQFTEENVFSYHCKIKSFELLKKLVKHNYKFWVKSKIDIFILFLASILRNSRIKNTEAIINYFVSFISYQDAYFINLLRVLIEETNNFHTMEIFGKLYNRTQSPDFSVPNNAKDTILFMKALLVFSDFAPYLTEHDQNEKCLNEIKINIFTKEEGENEKFISCFHF